MSKRFWKIADFAPPLEQPERRVLRDLGGGGGTTQTNTVTKSDPWDAVQPYLRDVFGRAQTQYQNGGTLAPQSPYTLQAIQQQAASATDPNSLVARSQAELGRTINGDYLTAAGNPALQAAVDTARRTVNQQFNGDNYGGSAHQEWLARGAASAASPILSQERQNQLQAMQLAPSMQGANTAQLAQAGQAVDARSQAEMDAPYNNFSRYANTIFAGGGMGGSSSSQGQQPYYSNPMANALGMGLGGLALYNGLGAAGLFGGAAAAGGALAPFAGMGGSSLALMMSDVRVKEDIERIGTHDSGIGIYKYRYKGNPGLHVGVMAQEVAEVDPEAVHDVGGGLLAVDYSRI